MKCILADDPNQERRLIESTNPNSIKLTASASSWLRKPLFVKVGFAGDLATTVCLRQHLMYLTALVSIRTTSTDPQWRFVKSAQDYMHPFYPNFLNILLKKETWQRQWNGCQESTSSSKSGLHFGHYLAGVASNHISHF